MVDIHSHILPQVDDGARSWETAVEMCWMAVKDGTRQIVATPHANDEYNYDRPRNLELAARLQQEIGDALTILVGCDFHCSFDNFEELQKSPETFTIQGTRYLLVEFSDYSLHPVVIAAVMDLPSDGIVPIITHPERNPILQRRTEQILEFAEAGCLVQVTANSITGYWGSTPKKVSRWLLEQQAIHVVASDAHNLTSRPPLLSEARKAVAVMAGEAVAEELFVVNPQAIVSNGMVPVEANPLGR